ncbi:hypothetical protein Nepgr_021125 [Nepenthes gracilis]|uniref:Uncharacterized protein n=1 Tax=Nepenthes gracilis TaxID=150966 RepID=A0AAD3SY54_NEPGR|nr:hypothetical protein Nepgr_021125 [Nepenthes gracilis]
MVWREPLVSLCHPYPTLAMRSTWWDLMEGASLVERVNWESAKDFCISTTSEVRNLRAKRSHDGESKG